MPDLTNHNCWQPANCSAAFKPAKFSNDNCKHRINSTNGGAVLKSIKLPMTAKVEAKDKTLQ